MRINGFDIDGVIHLGNGSCGIHPGPKDVIITGRSYEEEAETFAFLHKNKIYNAVFFNQVDYDNKSRSSSGCHKGETILKLKKMGIVIDYFFEDDEIQKNEIEKAVKENSLSTKVIHVSNPFVQKENARHLEDLND
tara:strand:+ start:416 stop:823 length:408 start_codon:yes stop_codon:yes gene_type:complete